MKVVLLCVLVLGLVLAASSQTFSRRISLGWGEFECSCSLWCPSYGIKGNYCFDHDYGWGWGVQPRHCCIRSAFDFDLPGHLD